MRLICLQSIALITLILVVLASHFDPRLDCEYGAGQFVRDGVLSTQRPEGGTNFRNAVIFGYSGFTRASTASAVPAMKIAMPLAPDHKTRFDFHFASSDCYGPTPSGYTRIFIAYRADANPGIGTVSDPFDGSTAEKFDALLRARSEGGVSHLV